MGTLLDTLARHLRYAFRTLRRSPTFAAASLLTLALGIGATTAVFSVVNGVLLNPLRYPEPETLVGVLTRAPGAPGANGVGDLPESASMFVTFTDQNRSFDSIGIWFAFAWTVTGLAEPEQARTVGVSPGVLESFRVQPLLGRWFVESDYRPGSADAVMLGWGYWQRRFGGDPGVIGRAITVDSRPQRIVGVMPQGFRVVTTDPELIVPLRLDRSQMFLVPFNFQTIARLKPGVTLVQATADLARLIDVWMDSWGMPPGFGAGGRPFESWRLSPIARPLKDDVIGTVGRVLWVLMGTIGVVLVIACANVANLVLVRAEGRQQELAVRAALGAGSWRIVRELLLESVWLGILGGVLGLGLAYAGVRLLVALGPSTLPRLHEISLDGRVLTFALAVSLLSGLLFGLIPAVKSAGRRGLGLLAASRGASDSRARQRTRNGLVVAQVALALVLLVSSGLMLRTFLALRAVEPGFVPQDLQTLRIAIPSSVAATPDRVSQVQKQILEALAGIPGVTSAALSTAMPMEGMLPNPIFTSRSPFAAASDTADIARTRPLRWFKYVSPGFFRTAGTRLVTGREYTWLDLEALRSVVIVSENLAVELWGSASAALGQRVRALPNGSSREVIGVVEDVRENGVHEAPPAIVYWPSRTESFFQAGQADVPRAVAFAVRTPRAGSEALLNALRERVWSVNKNLPLALVRTMNEVYDQSMARTSFTLVMLAIAGIMALALGVVGIYGVISYAVARRTREVGIRLALGAPPGELRGMFLRYGLALTSMGVAIGFGAAAALTRLLRSLLFQVSPLDPLTYAAVAAALIGVALCACYVPARRASGIDPAVALRAD
jgi:predicted permease